MYPINQSHPGKVTVNIKQDKTKNVHVIFNNLLDADRLKFRLIAAGIMDSSIADQIQYTDSRYPGQYVLKLNEEEYKAIALRFRDDMPPHDIKKTLDEISVVNIDTFPTVATFPNLGYDETRKIGVGVDDTGLKIARDPHYKDETKYAKAYKAQKRQAKAKLSHLHYEEYKLQAKEQSISPYFSKKEQKDHEVTVGYGGMFLEKSVKYDLTQMSDPEITYLLNNNPVIRRAVLQEDGKRDQILFSHGYNPQGLTFNQKNQIIANNPAIQFHLNRDTKSNETIIKENSPSYSSDYPLVPTDGKYYFAVTQDDSGYHVIVSPVVDEGLTKHAILGRNADVKAAGFLEFKQGKLISIDNNSGHYRPKTQEMMDFYTQLFRSLPYKDDVIIYDYGRNKKTLDQVFDEFNYDTNNMTAMDKFNAYSTDIPLQTELVKHGKVFQANLSDVVRNNNADQVYSEAEDRFLKFGGKAPLTKGLTPEQKLQKFGEYWNLSTAQTSPPAQQVVQPPPNPVTTHASFFGNTRAPQTTATQTQVSSTETSYDTMLTKNSDAAKIKMHISKISPHENADDISSILSVLNSSIVSNKNGSTPKIIQEIRTMLGNTSPHNTEELTNTLLEIKTKIGKTNKGGMSKETIDVLNAFSHANSFRRIREDLSKNADFHFIMSPGPSTRL